MLNDIFTKISNLYEGRFLFIATETQTDTRSKITSLDRTFQYSHHQWLCIFTSDKQEPSYCARKINLSHTSPLHYLVPNCAYIHCLVDGIVNNGCNLFRIKKIRCGFSKLLSVTLWIIVKKVH